MKKISSTNQKGERQGRTQRKICLNRGQNYDDTHNVFLQHFDEDCEEEIGLPFYQRPKEDYLEKEVEPGDTLHTLAIQFNCPIAELKRINNIHRENEVFARRKIKVPVKYYSLLSEKLVGVHKTPKSSKEGNTCTSFEESSFLPKYDLTSLLEGTSKTLSNSIQESLEQDRVSFLPTSDTPFDNCDTDVVTPLLQQNSQPLPSNNKTNGEAFQCNGSDWGISWPHLVIFTLLLGFAGPIVFFYLKSKNGSHVLSNHTSH